MLVGFQSCLIFIAVRSILMQSRTRCFRLLGIGLGMSAWRPLSTRYIEECSVKWDYVRPNPGETHIGVDMVKDASRILR